MSLYELVCSIDNVVLVVIENAEHCVTHHRLRRECPKSVVKNVKTNVSIVPPVSDQISVKTNKHISVEAERFKTKDRHPFSTFYFPGVR